MPRGDQQPPADVLDRKFSIVITVEPDSELRFGTTALGQERYKPTKLRSYLGYSVGGVTSSFPPQSRVCGKQQSAAHNKK